MEVIEDKSIALIVTSPPYPMIEMWDQIFAKQNPEIQSILAQNNGMEAFELMHLELDKVWQECNRVLIPGGFCCINIGDATRTIDGNFALYSNHSRIIRAFSDLQFSNLPAVIWRKATNAPNKFMGSGMLPAGAYVTLEHEWILIFRKGNKRLLSSGEQIRRRESAFFWEERNSWFSDIWEYQGTRQKINELKDSRRSAAFPFEIPYRLINMYSIKNDQVLDPFGGTGTTTLAAIASQRDSVMFDIDPEFIKLTYQRLNQYNPLIINEINSERLSKHAKYIQNRIMEKGKESIKYFNQFLDQPVVTNQETWLRLPFVQSIEPQDFGYLVEYAERG